MTPDHPAEGPPAAAPADPRALVREGYDRASHAYRGDTFPFERSGYEYWLGRLLPRLAPGARVLDLGCGNGIPVSQELAARGFAVTGVDLSPVQVERARALVPEARFVCADMTAAELPPGGFDAAVAFYSVINVPLADQPALIARVADWLVPGGWFLATVGRYAWTGIETDWRRVPGLRMYYSQADVATYRRWFAAAGLVVAEEGVQPREGRPGYSMLVARRAGPAEAVGLD